MLELILVGGLLTALSIAVLLHKIKKKRYEDAAIDTGITAFLFTAFAGSLAGMSIAVVASLLISIYLLFFGSTDTIRQFIAEVRRIVKEHI